MSSGRDAVRMTEAELDGFLRGNRKVQVATNGPGGAPHLTTLFYVLDDEDRITFWTYRRTQKVANLRRDPTITCLVEDGDDYFELRGATVTGRARLVEDYDEVHALGTRVAAAMAGGVDLGELGEQLVSAQAHKRVGVVVEPDRITSWDHRKMTALPGGVHAPQPTEESS